MPVFLHTKKKNNVSLTNKVVDFEQPSPGKQTMSQKL